MSKSILKDFKDFFIPSEERRQKGTDLGIFYFLSTWVLLNIILLFIDDSYISFVIDAYFGFDLLSLAFISLYYFNKKKKEGEKSFQFPNFYELSLIIVFNIWIFFVFNLMWLLIEPLMYNLSLEYVLFDLIKIPPTEELVFRGLCFFIPIYVLNYFFNKNNDSKRNNLFWAIIIVIVSVIFGIAHIPAYYSESTFPYFITVSNGVPIEIHIALPIAYVTLLSLFIGFSYYEFGLFSAILLHTINNAVASNFISVDILFYLSLIPFLIVLIKYFKKEVK